MHKRQILYMCTITALLILSGILISQFVVFGDEIGTAALVWLGL